MAALPKRVIASRRLIRSVIGQGCYRRPELNVGRQGIDELGATHLRTIIMDCSRVCG
jgi:hypothetical protein